MQSDIGYPPAMSLFFIRLTLSMPTDHAKKAVANCKKNLLLIASAKSVGKAKSILTACRDKIMSVSVPSSVGFAATFSPRAKAF